MQAISVCIFLLIFTLKSYAGIPSRPEIQRLVNDFAQIFTTRETAKLEHILTAFDDSTSNQIVVITVKTLEGYSPAEYAYKIGQTWGIGSKDFNNGIVILIKPKQGFSQGELSIQVGYGLEGAIPDAYCKRIIEQKMIPHFKNGDYFSGTYAAVETLMALASGEISKERETKENLDNIADIIFIIILFALFIYLSYRKNGGSNDNHSNGNERKDILPFILWSILRSGRGGGNRGSGGGFGGFGGGSFGGGGASGKW